MLNSISHIGIWVTDQDEALTFYRDKLGFEVRRDVTMPDWNARWLTVGIPGEDTELVLHAFDLPFLDDETKDRIRTTLASGFNPPLIFAVDDCRATIEDLRAKGVDISQEPSEEFYGVDAGIRDPSGNSIRITQHAQVPAA